MTRNRITICCCFLALCLWLVVGGEEEEEAFDKDNEMLRQFGLQVRGGSFDKQRKFYASNYIYGSLCENYIRGHGGDDPCQPNGSCDDTENAIRCVCRNRRDGGRFCQFRNVCKRNPCPGRHDLCIPTTSPSKVAGRYCISRSYFNFRDYPQNYEGANMENELQDLPKSYR